MDRRDFLKYMLSTPVAMTLDVEKLLWIPGEKTIFLPPAPSITMDEVFLIHDTTYGSEISKMFYANNKFYEILKNKQIEVMQGNTLNIPLGHIPIKKKLF